MVTTTNAISDKISYENLSRLKTKLYTGADSQLSLKVGAQGMMLNNDKRSVGG